MNSRIHDNIGIRPQLRYPFIRYHQIHNIVSNRTDRGFFEIKMLKLFFCITLLLFSSFVGAEEKVVRVAINDWTPFASPELENNGPLAEVSRTAFERVGYAMTLDFLNNSCPPLCPR